MFAATAYDLYESRHLLSMADAEVFATGFVAAFLSALAAVKFCCTTSRITSLSLFAWYRIAFGCLVLAYNML